MKTPTPHAALSLLTLARTTPTGVVVLSSTDVATGWSVKKTLLGKNVYNEVSKKVGAV